MQKVNLKEATTLILKALGYPETVDNFNKFYRPLLKEINENRMSSEKRGKGHIINRNDIEEYIAKLKKEEENKVIIYDKNTNDFVVNKNYIVNTADEQSFKSSVQALVTLYKNKNFTAEKAMNEIMKIL